MLGTAADTAAGTAEEDRPSALSDCQIQQNSLPFDSRIGLYLHNTKAYVSMLNESGGMPTDYLYKLIFIFVLRMICVKKHVILFCLPD